MPIHLYTAVHDHPLACVVIGSSRRPPVGLGRRDVVAHPAIALGLCRRVDERMPIRSWCAFTAGHEIVAPLSLLSHIPNRRADFLVDGWMMAAMAASFVFILRGIVP